MGSGLLCCVWFPWWVGPPVLTPPTPEGRVSENGLVGPLDPTGEYEGQLERGAEDGPEVATPPVTFSLCFLCWRRGSIGIPAPLQHAHQTGDQKDQAAFAVPSVVEQLGHGDWYLVLERRKGLDEPKGQSLEGEGGRSEWEVGKAGAHWQGLQEQCEVPLVQLGHVGREWESRRGFGAEMERVTLYPGLFLFAQTEVR